MPIKYLASQWNEVQFESITSIKCPSNLTTPSYPFADPSEFCLVNNSSRRIVSSHLDNNHSLQFFFQFSWYL